MKYYNNCKIFIIEMKIFNFNKKYKLNYNLWNKQSNFFKIIIGYTNFYLILL